MATEVPGLADKVQEVIEAAIEAEIHTTTSFYGSCSEGFEGPGRATEANALPPDVKVTYPDGETYVYDYPDDSVEPLFDLLSIFDKWDRDIHQVFDRWLELPDPSDFDSRIATMQAVAAGLAVGGVTVNEEGDRTEVAVGNTDAQTWVSDVQAELNDYEGIAFETLSDSYLSRLDDVFSGQHSIATVLGVCLAAEKEIWAQAREDIVDIAEKARRAFEAVGSGGNASFSQVLGVAGSFLGAIGLFASGPAAIVIGGISSATGIVSAFLPSEPSGAEEVELGGDDVMDVYGNLCFAVSETNSRIGQEEQAGYLTCLNVMDTVQTRLDAFDIGTPTDFLAETDRGDLFRPAENVALLMPGLREIAGKVDALAGVMSAVRHDVAGTTGSGPWERDAILGHLGYTGYYFTWEDLHGQLMNVLNRSSRVLGDLAERMVLVSYDFQRTEDQIDADLRQLAGELPDPTPRTAVPYGHA